MILNSKSTDNVVSVVFRLLSCYNVKTTLSLVNEYLKPHTDYPSLKSVCDYFEDISVANYPLRIDEHDFFNISDPFIAHMNIGSGKIYLVYKTDNNTVIYSDSLKSRKSMKTNDFLAKWSKTVIIIDPDSDSGESDYKARKSEEIVNKSIVPFYISLFCLIFIYGIFSSSVSTGEKYPVPFLLLVAANLAGLFFSILLFMHEFEFRTGFADKLCHISTHTDCDAVTKSRLSKIYANISWADAGVSYFLSVLIIMLLLPASSSIRILSILSVLSLPYPVFSILYQWLKIKKWCPLCLSVQATLLAQFAILTVNLKFKDISSFSFLPALIIMAAVFGTVYIIKIFYLSEKEKEFIQFELQKLKRNPSVFRSQINSGKQNNISHLTQQLLFGNLEAEVTITVFLSYNCSACSKKFAEIRKILKSNKKMKVQLIFAPAKDEDGLNLTKFILQNYKAGRTEIVLSLLEKWYDTDIKSRSNLFKNLESGIDESEFNDFLKSNEKLFRENNITGVPTLFINGFSFPGTYKLNDLKYHLDSIVQLKKIQIENKVLI
jgi:protein-disulfide isomerase/uncharacterized membrane protein